jgi:hypothetical protein
MGLKERIISELEKENYLSDRNLTDRIFGSGAPQQAVNQMCRHLETIGKIKRTTRPIKNYILLTNFETDESTYRNVELAALPVTPKKELRDKLIQGKDRSVYLKAEFNTFWNSFWATNERDYYSEIPLSQMVALKMAVANINNLITLEISIRAAKLIGHILKQNDSVISFIIRKVKSVSANCNGYDIEYSGDAAYICEVKANIPVNGVTFGAAQRQQIVKDIYGLLNGKSKSIITGEQLAQHYKFLCLYLDGANTVHAINALTSKLDKEIKNKVKLYHEGNRLTMDNVYVIFASLDDN